MNKRFLLLALFALIAALTRVIPHPLNFAPLAGIALFSAAYVKRKDFALLLPLVAYFISDLLVNNIVYAQYYDSFVFVTPGFMFTYGSILLITFIGFVLLKKVSFVRVMSGSLLASLLFFLVTNFGAWLGNPTYPQTFEGLMISYNMGLPFVKNTMLGDLFYSAVLFGGFEAVSRYAPDWMLKTDSSLS
ncbi:MAG: DUF6580 family putative transport protein [Bacteroidota bacterium]